MPLEVDHAFIACAHQAPEGDALLRLGFVEGSRNTHPGQGTANRRFYFENFMLELMWVADAAEAQSAQTRRTRLWDRWSQRQSGVSPFGIVFRAAGDQDSAAPFPTWAYYPSYLPPGLAIQIAEETRLQEPELFYLPFLKMPGIRAGEPLNHAAPIRRVRALKRRESPNLPEISHASRVVESQGLVQYFQSQQPILEILFDFRNRPGCRFTAGAAAVVSRRIIGKSKSDRSPKEFADAIAVIRFTRSSPACIDPDSCASSPGCDLHRSSRG